MANNYGGPFGIRSADNDSAASIGGTITSGTTGSVLFVGAGPVLAQDNANFFYDDTNNRLGLLTAAPTHSLTLGSTATGIAYFNTADQTTNYERALLSWSSNVFTLRLAEAGTGTGRNLSFETATATLALTNGGQMNFTGTQTTDTTPMVLLHNGVSWSSSSAVQDSLRLTGTVNQTSTAGWRGIVVNPTLTAVGSAGASLLDLQAASVSKFRVDSAGNAIISSAATSGVVLHGLADETTNTETASMKWSASILKISTAATGTGTVRNIQIFAGGSSTLAISASGTSSYTGGVTTGSGVLFTVTNGSSWSSTSLVQDAFVVSGTVNQASGTGGWRGLVVNPTLTAVGSTSAWLMDLQVASTSMLRVNSAGRIGMSGTVTAGGTTGAQTINKPCGTVNFAGGASTLVVTNSTVTTSSIVKAVVRTNDTTATIKNVVPASGSFTITLTAAATAETSVGFEVIEPI